MLCQLASRKEGRHARKLGQSPGNQVKTGIIQDALHSVYNTTLGQRLRFDTHGGLCESKEQRLHREYHELLEISKAPMSLHYFPRILDLLTLLARILDTLAELWMPWILSSVSARVPQEPIILEAIGTLGENGLYRGD